jgi:hypothetical protein
MAKQKAPRKPRRVSYALIASALDPGKGMYKLLAALVRQHHDELRDARIALAWNSSWKPDVDGRVTLGKCKRASDLDRELAPYDFVIILRRQFWIDTEVTDLQRRALLDHELMHADVALDEQGEPQVDTNGRTVYRLRRHDLEEFAVIAERYGCWKRDLETFAAALRRSKQPPLALVPPAEGDQTGEAHP